MTTRPRALAPLWLLLALALAPAGARGMLAEGVGALPGSFPAATLGAGDAISDVPAPLSPAALLDGGVRLPAPARLADVGAGPLGGARPASAVHRSALPALLPLDVVRARLLARAPLGYLSASASARSGRLAAPPTAPPSLA